MAVEQLPETRDVCLETVGGGRRRALAPHLVDQPVDGHDLGRPQEEHREHRALLRPS